MAVKELQLVSIIIFIYLDYIYATDFINACFYNSEARLRYGDNRCVVNDIHFGLCTHYIYRYAKIDPVNKNVLPLNRAEEEGEDKLYKQFTNARLTHPYMKTILSLGGPGSATDAAFEALYRSDPSFISFAQNVMYYLAQYQFHGVNIHWEMASDSSGKGILTQLLQKLRQRSDSGSQVLITMTGFALPSMVQAKYDVPEIQKYVHYVFVQSTDLATPDVASFIDPLFPNPQNQASQHSMNESLRYWNQRGMPYDKLVMGVSPMGHFVLLKDASRYQPGAEVSAYAVVGPKYLIAGRLTQPEICDMLPTSRRYYDDIQKSPYLVKGREWVGYTDTASLVEKIQFVKNVGLAGIAIMYLDEDDFSGISCQNGRLPLAAFIKQNTTVVSPPASTTTTTRTTTVDFPTEISTETTTTITTTTTSVATTEEPPDEFLDCDVDLGVKLLILLVLFGLGYITGYLFIRFFNWQMDDMSDDSF